MNSDKKALNAAADALGVGAAKVDTAYAAMESAIGAVNEIKAKLVTASEQSTDKSQIQLEISKLQEQLSAIAQGASFSGENWLVTQNTQANVVDGFVREADGTVKVTVATFNVGTYALFSTIGANGLGSGGVLGSIMSVALTSVSTQGDIDGFMNIVESALSKMTDSAAAIGALQIRVELQDKYSSKLSDAIEAGVSRLIDADMEEESARLSAVQTQQQLAIQSLSIANSSSQNLLSLFRQ
jgi:flagellin